MPNTICKWRKRKATLQGRYGGKEGGKGAGGQAEGKRMIRGRPKGTFAFSMIFQRFCYSMWLFHLHSAVKNRAFFPVFPLAGSTAKAFFRLSLWNFKEKTSIFFYNTAILLVTPLEFRESASHFLMARPSKTSGKRMLPLRAITQKSRSRGRGIYVPDVVSGTTAPEEAVPVHTISRLLSTPCRE